MIFYLFCVLLQLLVRRVQSNWMTFDDPWGPSSPYIAAYYIKKKPQIEVITKKKAYRF